MDPQSQAQFDFSQVLVGEYHFLVNMLYSGLILLFSSLPFTPTPFINLLQLTTLTTSSRHIHFELHPFINYKMRSSAVLLFAVAAPVLAGSAALHARDEYIAARQLALELEARELANELIARSNGKWGHVIENVANGMDALASGVNIGTSIYG